MLPRRKSVSRIFDCGKKIAEKISGIKGVIGVLATGCIGRGFCDDYSDLDLIVYADDTQVKKIRKYVAIGTLRYKNIDLDTPVESYQKALKKKSPSHYWSQVLRLDRKNSLILFDRGDRIRKMLKKNNLPKLGTEKNYGKTPRRNRVLSQI